MKKLSKIHIKGTIFISTNLLILINKVSNATPILRFSKPSTVALLGEVIRNPTESFIQKLPNGNLKANFLVSGKHSVLLRNFNIKGKSNVGVKKTINSDYKIILPSKSHRKLTEEGVAFRVFTHSKSGLDKQIDIFEENGSIVVNSKKNEGTPNFIFKSTILNFGDGASTSSQSSSSDEPIITSKRYSNYDKNSGRFIIEQTNIYNPLSLKLISSETKNFLNGETTSSSGSDPQTRTTRDVFFKTPTIQLLSETAMNPETAPITKTPEGKIRARFLHFGRASASVRNVLVKSKSLITVKKNIGDTFEEIQKVKGKMNLESEGVEFIIHTRSKYGLNKKIHITQENGDIVVNSTKGENTPNHSIKKTVLNLVDSLSSPKITQTKLSLPNNETKQFDLEEQLLYDATTHTLISQTTKNNSTGKTEHFYRNPDNTKTKIVEQANGSKYKYLLTEKDEIIYSEGKDQYGNTLMTRTLTGGVLSHKKFNANGNLVEETVSSPTQYESHTYDENGFITSSTRSNTLPNGESVGTTIYLNGESITQERRSDGSLISTIIRTTTGELFKQDFNTNNLPINNTYKIN